MLNTGDTFTLTVEEIVGDNKKVSISYPGLVEDVDTGSTILIDDGLIELKVEACTDTDITCRVINGGPVSARKGINVPGVQLSLPFISDGGSSALCLLSEIGLVLSVARRIQLKEL